MERSFAKEMRALKMRGVMASHQKLTTASWEHHQCWSSYDYTRSCPRTHCRPLCGLSAFEANWKREKLDWWVSRELTGNQKTVILKRHLLSYVTTVNHFSIWLWCAMKVDFIWQPGDGQLSGWTEKQLQSASQSQTCPQSGPGHCLVVCCQSDPL